MDNIHSPTVPSGPASSTHRPASPSQDETPLLDLINDKDRVESELRALISVLESVNIPPFYPRFLLYNYKATYTRGSQKLTRIPPSTAST